MCSHTLSSNDGKVNLDFMYPGKPNPLDTWEQNLRFTHQDLNGMSVSELGLEQVRLRRRLEIENNQDPWLIERWDAIEEELKNVRSQ